MIYQLFCWAMIAVLAIFAVPYFAFQIGKSAGYGWYYGQMLFLTHSAKKRRREGGE